MTPEQEEQVARALAETARHEPIAPMPPEVSGRLDDVLADLVAPRVAAAASGDRPPGAGEPRGPQPGARGSAAGGDRDELAAARRRRRPQLLAAAAAVSVIALAGAAVATGGFGTTRSGSGTAEDSTAGGFTENGADAGGSSEDRSFAEDAQAAPQLHTATLARDVKRVVDGGLPTGRAQLAVPAPGKKPSAARSCLTPTARPGERLVPVRLDGRPASLLLGAEQDGVRKAMVYSCASATAPLARLSVRAR